MHWHGHGVLVVHGGDPPGGNGAGQWGGAGVRRRGRQPDAGAGHLHPHGGAWRPVSDWQVRPKKKVHRRGDMERHMLALPALRAIPTKEPSDFVGESDLPGCAVVLLRKSATAFARAQQVYQRSQASRLIVRVSHIRDTVKLNRASSGIQQAGLLRLPPQWLSWHLTQVQDLRRRCRRVRPRRGLRRVCAARLRLSHHSCSPAPGGPARCAQ